MAYLTGVVWSAGVWGLLQRRIVQMCINRLNILILTITRKMIMDGKELIRMAQVKLSIMRQISR